jgi:predicted nucleotidyltransferase
MLRAELGEDLRAVWLYGSRARGEPPHDESDIDLIVLVDPSREWDPWGREILPLIAEAADAEGVSPVWISAFVRDPDWLRGRREINSFFIQEVDRDRIVLHGSGLE